MTDFIFMVRESSHMFITGPDVVKTVTGEEVTLEELGGAMSHASKSGVATFVAPDEKACLEDVRFLLSFLPQNNMEEPPVVEPTDDPDRLCLGLREILPPSPNQPYDMKKVIREVLDDGEFFEYFPHWAKSIVCGFGRLNGQSVGVVGNQPMVLAGVLDIESAEKAARFVRTCDAFNIPLITFVDVPGFLPGVDQEYGGIIRHGAKLLYAYCEATVPRIQVITRKAYGGAYVVMDSKSIGSDLAYAWPTAELAVMGPQGAVEIVYRRELQQAADPVARRAELVAEYTERYANPYAAAERGYIDDVIDPAETRVKLDRRHGHAEDQARGAPPAQAREHAPVSEVTGWADPAAGERRAVGRCACRRRRSVPRRPPRRRRPSWPPWRCCGRSRSWCCPRRPSAGRRGASAAAGGPGPSRLAAPAPGTERRPRVDHIVRSRRSTRSSISRTLSSPVSCRAASNDSQRSGACSDSASILSGRSVTSTKRTSAWWCAGSRALAGTGTTATCSSSGDGPGHGARSLRPVSSHASRRATANGSCSPGSAWPPTCSHACWRSCHRRRTRRVGGWITSAEQVTCTGASRSHGSAVRARFRSKATSAASAGDPGENAART